MAYKHKKVDLALLELHQQGLVRDGLKLLNDIEKLLPVAKKCLEAPEPAFPIWTRDIFDKVTYLCQLAGCHAVLTNILVKPR